MTVLVEGQSMCIFYGFLCVSDPVLRGPVNDVEFDHGQDKGIIIVLGQRKFYVHISRVFLEVADFLAVYASVPWLLLFCACVR